MLNHVEYIGRLTKDPVTKYTKTGTAIVEISIAYNHLAKEEKNRHVSYFECTAFGKTAEYISKNAQKGFMVYASGENKQQRWTDKDTNKPRTKTQLIIRKFIILYSSSAKEKTDEEKDNIGNSYPNDEDQLPAFTDDDIPF